MPGALGKAQFALGKGFVECCTRQRPLGKECVGKGIFAECLLSGTRQSLCRVPTLGKVETEKTRKNVNFNQKKWNFFLSMEARTGQRPPISDIFRVNFMATRPTRFEPETSRCAQTSSTTTPHCHLCLDFVLVPNILY